METNAKKLNTIGKGARIGDETIQGVLTMTMLSRRGAASKLTKDANSEEGRLLWTENSLFAYLPLADKQPSAWMRFERGEMSMLDGGMKAFIDAAKVFGDKAHLQELGSVDPFTVNDSPYEFCDIGRGGTDKGEEENEGKVANGKSLALRFIHLTTAKKSNEDALRDATHVLYTGPEDAENVFGVDGDVSMNMWINGVVFNPNDLEIEE